MQELSCLGCQASWNAGVDDLIRSGYWPATTIHEADLFCHFEDKEMALVGMSF